MLFSATHAMVHALQPVHDGEIDRHPPLVAVVFVLRVERQRSSAASAPMLLDDRRVRLVRLERRDAHRVAPFHQVMFLRGREQIAVSPVFAISRPRPNHGASEVRSRKALNRSASLAGVADAAGHAAAVAEEHRHRLRRMAGHDEHRHSRGRCRDISAR